MTVNVPPVLLDWFVQRCHLVARNHLTRFLGSKGTITHLPHLLEKSLLIALGADAIVPF